MSFADAILNNDAHILINNTYVDVLARGQMYMMYEQLEHFR